MKRKETDRMREQQLIAWLLADPQTVHWTYTPTEWQRYTTRIAQARQYGRRATFQLMPILGGFGLLAALAVYVQTSSLVYGLFVLAGVAGLEVILACGNGWSRRDQAGPGQPQTPGDAYVSPWGIILNGQYSSLNDGGWRLYWIIYQSGNPGVLHFEVNFGRIRRVTEVPVPAGREAEAVELARSLHRAHPGSLVRFG
jgi:hypothetical protein